MIEPAARRRRRVMTGVLFVTILISAGCSDVPGSRASVGSAGPPRGHSVPRRPEGVYSGKTFDVRALDDIMEESGTTISDPKIVIDKSDYILTLYSGSRRVKEYRILLGGNPIDDKRQEGDRCTPEGRYFVRDKYPHRLFGYFIWISYPDDEDRREFSRLLQAGLLPASAAIGGEIGIHGTNDDELQRSGRNWTNGCISLSRADLGEVYEHVSVGTPIIIRK